MNKQRNVLSLTNLQKTILINILNENKKNNNDDIRNIVINDILEKLRIEK